jgi:hypothetical protein
MYTHGLVMPRRLGYIPHRIHSALALNPISLHQIRRLCMQIQFLWWEDCPSHPNAWARLQQVLAEYQITSPVEQVEVRTDDEAEHWRFPGSPTILINGCDIDPSPAAHYRLTCRLYYDENGRPSPLPSLEMIRRAVAQALIQE